MNAQPLGGQRKWGGGGGGDSGQDAVSGSGSGYPPSFDGQQSNQGYNNNNMEPPQNSLPNIPPSAQAALAAARAIAGNMGLGPNAAGNKRAATEDSQSAGGYNNGASQGDGGEFSFKIGFFVGEGMMDSGRTESQSTNVSSFLNSTQLYPTLLLQSLTSDCIFNQSSPGPRKRRSRWGDSSEQVNLPTAIGSNVSQIDLEKYAIQVRLDEISRKLLSGDVVPTDRERSVSPPPQYDGQGRRINTREFRYKKKLEEEKLGLVEKQLNLDPNFKPPSDYQQLKKNSKPSEKVFLPIKEFPEINFFGLLVGPRGNSLKKMEKESGAKISIRGKGSVKDGKGRMGDEDEEEMHCVVTGEEEAQVKKCVRLINLVIETVSTTIIAGMVEMEKKKRRNASLKKIA